MTRQRKPERTYNGFAIPLEPGTELGSGMLVVEFSDGTYQPVAAVATINEARELAADDLNIRMRKLEGGLTPICPERYIVWARGFDGIYCQAARIERQLGKALLS